MHNIPNTESPYHGLIIIADEASGCWIMANDGSEAHYRCIPTLADIDAFIEDIMPAQF